MGRAKGSVNKNSASIPTTMTMTPAERITFLANLIIDRILEDQKQGMPILNSLSKP